MANFFTDCKNTKDYLTSEDNSRNCDDLKTDGSCKDNKWADINTLENDKLIGFPTENCCACGKGTDNNPICIDTKDWEFKEKVTDGATPSPTKYNCQYLADKGFCKDRYYDRGKDEEFIKLSQKTGVSLKDIKENCCVCGKVDRFGDPAINEEGCPFSHPFRTRFKEHKEDSYKYCYKKKECLSKIDKCKEWPMRHEVQKPVSFKRTNKRFWWPPLNDENCHEDYPYRTRLKKHEKDGFKICYKEKDCATGKKKCDIAAINTMWPDKPKIWPPLLKKKYKPKSKADQGFMAKTKKMFGGGSNSILFMLILIISLYLVIKMNKKK
jgi:hypothetical protein